MLESAAYIMFRFSKNSKKVKIKYGLILPIILHLLGHVLDLCSLKFI